MKQVLGIAFLLMGVAGVCQVKVSSDKVAIVGKWKFEVSNAPYSYQKGDIMLKDDGGLKGSFTFGNGQMLPFNNISFSGDTLRVKAVVEYEEVNITLVLMQGMLKGKVSTSEGDMAIVAEKKDE